jgi:hypothetical protein
VSPPWKRDTALTPSIGARYGTHPFRRKLLASSAFVASTKHWYQPETNNGIFFFGEKATIFAADESWTVIPRGKLKQRRDFKAAS